jgi:hypothetical protein
MTHFLHPRTGTTALLPHLAPATELLVIDPVAQHAPRPDPEFAKYSVTRLGPFHIFQKPVQLNLEPSTEIWTPNAPDFFEFIPDGANSGNHNGHIKGHPSGYCM